MWAVWAGALHLESRSEVEIEGGRDHSNLRVRSSGFILFVCLAVCLFACFLCVLACVRDWGCGYRVKFTLDNRLKKGEASIDSSLTVPLRKTLIHFGALSLLTLFRSTRLVQSFWS